MTFGEILAKCMDGRTQGELAEMLGISQSHVSRLLVGTRGPGFETVRRMIMVFPERKAELMDFFFGREYANPTEDMPGGAVVSEEAR